MNVTWWSAILLCLAGGAGAAARFMVDGWVRSFTTDRFPVGTMIINVVGSAAFGVVVGVAIARDLPDAWELIVGGGFLGGFTTLSTASFETIALIRQRRHLAAAFNAVGTLVLSVAVAVTGLAWGLALAPQPAASPRAATSPSPVVSEPPDALPLPASPELPNPAPSFTWGLAEFAGVSVGEPIERIGQVTGMTLDTCGQASVVRYFVNPGQDIANDWALWVVGSFPADEDGVAIVSFDLEATSLADLSVPFGPTGPHGLQLGSSAANVLAMFPETTTREVLHEYNNEWHTQYIVGGAAPVVYTARNDAVVSIRWGTAELADGWDEWYCYAWFE